MEKVYEKTTQGLTKENLTKVLSNRVSPELLRPGDHVYSWRSAFSYAHHGIYMGNGRVIHFTRREGEDLTGTVLDRFASVNGSSPCENARPCQTCGVEACSNGVVCSCLSCFLSGCQLYRYDYGKNTIKFLLNVRGGTCTLALSDPPDVVMHRAHYLLRNGFRCYNVFNSNCEDFAMYCKTGLLIVRGNVVGAGGQATTVVGAPLAALVSCPVLIAGPLGMVAVTVGLYCLSRYVADVKNRPGTLKIAVEDLVQTLSPLVLASQQS